MTKPRFIQIAVGVRENELFALDQTGQVWRRNYCEHCGLYWQPEADVRGHDEAKHVAAGSAD